VFTGTDQVGDDELTAKTMFVPPIRFGPPESPKQVPPLFRVQLDELAADLLLLATSVVCAKTG